MAAASLTSEQRSREKAIEFALLSDLGILVLALVIGIAGGSLTLIAECIRGALIITIESFSLYIMRRVHRQTLFNLEFGTGKIELVANFAVATGLLIGGAWVLFKVIGILTGETALGPPLGLTLAAIVAAINTCINIVAWDRMRHAARTGGSIIMAAQLRSRFVRVVSSLFVQLTMTIAAVSIDHTVAVWAEAIGSTFVTFFILSVAIEMYRSGLPDLLDRSVEESTQMAINRVLARHFADYALLGRIRTRRSGSTIFIEMILGYDPSLTIAEIGDRVEAMKRSIREQIDNVDITIVAQPAESAHG